jgi:hypothetical protein
MRRLYGDLLAARREWPALRDFGQRSARLVGEENAVLELVRGSRTPEAGQTVQAFFNLSDRPRTLPAIDPSSRKLLFSSELRRYAGSRSGTGEMKELLPHECVVFGPAEWKGFA